MVWTRKHGWPTRAWRDAQPLQGSSRCMTRSQWGLIPPLCHCPKFKTPTDTKCWTGCKHAGLFHMATTLENGLILNTEHSCITQHSLCLPDTEPQETRACCPRKHAPWCWALYCEDEENAERMEKCIVGNSPKGLLISSHSGALSYRQMVWLDLATEHQVGQEVPKYST